MISLDGGALTLEDLREVALEGTPCELSSDARQRVAEARGQVERTLESGEVVYGINTGFGDLAREIIPADQTEELQHRLLRSHSAGIGDPLPEPVVRAMLLLRANALAKGHSGVRPELVDLVLELLNRNLLPVVPSRGSVGASGDLAPLAHLALPLTGKGKLLEAGLECEAGEALERAGLSPLRLGAKEGLALINGTQASCALAAIALLEAGRLVKLADLIGALSTEAVRGADTPFDPRLHEVRPHPGQQASAANLWRLLAGSEIRESHRENDPRVQDPYSFRCMPQVHGAVRDVLDDAGTRLTVEINSATDNPLVFADAGAILAGGNFHAEPIAFAADFMAIALCELGSISERRTEKLNQTTFSGLPPFLTPEPGLNSGLMIAQVTAAALLAESRVLAHPASVDSVPTSADKEDHVSMSMGAALKLQEVVCNVRRILAIELICGAQGIDLLRPLRSSEPLERLHADFRRLVPKLEEDRELAGDLEAAESYLASGVDSHLTELG